MSVNQTHTKTTREMFWATGAAEFAGPHLDGVPAIRPLRTFQDRTSYASLTKGPAVFAGGGGGGPRLRLGCKLAFGLQIGVWAANWRSAANWRLGCKLAFGLQLEFWLQNDVRIFSRTGHSYFPAPHIVCFPDNRPCGVCGAAPRLRPCDQALRTFRGRTSYASLLTLWCLRGRNTIASLRTGPSDFSGRTSYASPTTGPAVFAGPELDCVPANRPFGLYRAAHRMLP